MKHLKKLSVAIMMVTLFSGTFTSCIDNEVSPIVEAIYEAQADLIAAQANLQNAEAEYKLAQAAAENAAAAELNAVTARYVAMTVIELREATADANLAVEEARIAMLLAQAEFDQDLAQIADAIRIAANVEAGIHAADYATAMGELAILKSSKLSLLQEIATKELYMKSTVVNSEMTWNEYLAGLQREVLAKQASVASNAAFIVRANAYLGNYDARVAALDAAEAAVTAKEAEIQALLAEDAQIDAAIATGGGYDTYISNYNTLVSQLTGLKADLKLKQDDAKLLNETTIPGLQTKITNYAGTSATLLAAKVAADAVVGKLKTSTVAGSGLLGDIETINATLGSYGSDPVYVVGATTGNSVPRTATAPAVLSAQDILWNADLALLIFNENFADLTASYNEAVAELAIQKAAFAGSSYTGDLATANTNYTTAVNALATAQSAYNAAKTAFEANPNGTTIGDGILYTNAAVGTVGTAVFVDDNDAIGIHSDLGLKSYARVTSWKLKAGGTTSGGPYIPATYGTKYTPSDLAVIIAAINLQTNPIADGNIVIWEQNGTSVNGDGTTANTLLSGTGAAVAGLTGTQVDPTIATIPTAAYFMELEADDTSVTNVQTFNIATNKLGTNSYSNRPFTVNGAAPTGSNWTAALTVLANDDAGYDTTWDGDTANTETNNALTVQAVKWNMALELAKKQYYFDKGGDALADAQEEYDYQKDLFDNGLATRVTLTAAVAAAEAVVGQVWVSSTSPASGLLGQLQAKTKQLGSTEFVTYNSATPPVMTAPTSASGAKTTGVGSTENVDWYYVPGTTSGKILTSYAVKWNATLAYVKHLATPLTGAGSYTEQLATAQASLVTANNYISEYNILIARKTADIAALTAEYNALVATPLYAAQQVRILEIADEIAVLQAEKTVLQAEVTALDLSITFETLGTINAIESAISVAQGVINGAPAFYAIKAAQIAQGNVTVANLAAEVAKLKLDLVVLDARIAAKAAEAAGYLALMNAALAS